MEARVDTVDVLAETHEPLRPLAMAAIIRYEAMLKEVEALSMRDD